MSSQLNRAVNIILGVRDKTGNKLGKASKDLKDMDRTAKKAGRSLDSASRSANSLGDSFGSLAGKIAMVGAAMGALAFPIVKAANFERSMAEVKAISGATGEEFTALNERAKELGRTTEFTASQAADGLKMLSMAGLDAKESVAALKPALDLALVGGIELGQSADYITNILGGMGLEVEDLSRVTDVLANTATSSNSTITELADAMSYAAPAAKAMGVPIEEVSAAMGVLHDNGIKGSRAGTALLNAFNQLATPTSKATAALKKLGVTISYNEDGSLNLIKTYKDLRDSGMGLAEASAIFGKRFGSAALAMASQIDKIESLSKANEKAEGSLSKMAEVYNKTAKGAFKNMMSAIEGIAIAFGEHLLPVLVPIMKGITAMVNLFTDLMNLFPRTTKLVITVGAVVGALALTFWAFNAALIAVRASMAAVAGTKIIATLLGIGPAAVTATGGMNMLAVGIRRVGLAFKTAMPLLLAFTVGWEIGKLLNKFDIVQKAANRMAKGMTYSFLKAKKGWTWLTRGDTGAVQKELDDAMKIYDQMFDEIGKKAPEAKKAHESVAEAAKVSAEEQKEAVVEATDEMADAYKDWRDKAMGYADDVKGAQFDLNKELRSMGREGMSDVKAWKNRRQEAIKYYKMASRAMEEGKRLAKAGDMEGSEKAMANAKKYAAAAKDAYKDLNEKVKSGKKTILSSSRALKISMTGVEKAGKLGIEILKAQEKAANDAADALDKSTGGALSGADVKQATDKAKENISGVKTATEDLSIDWGKKWREMQDTTVAAIEAIDYELRKIDGKVVKVYVNKVEKHATGGMAGGFRRMAGKLSGFGGGDRIKALLEAGEFIINKSAVRKYGPGLFHMLNNMSFDPLRAQVGGMISSVGNLMTSIPRFAMGGQVTAGAAGGAISLNLNLPVPGPAIQMQTDKVSAGEFIRQLEKMGRLSS